MDKTEIIKLTIKDASELLAKKQITSVELTQAYLDEIKMADAAIHAYLLVCENEALEQ